MAVKLLGNFVRYIGLSADPKPTIGVPPGSTFYETDTKDIYIYNGTAWSEANATVQTGDTINIGDLEGKDVEGATVTGRPMTIGYKNAAGKATGVSPENALPVQLSGSIETVVDNPATGIKTITTTAAELFAGAYAKTNRRKLIIKNEDQSLRFRIGKADITQQNGFPVEPGAVVIIPFDPAVIVPIYAISEGASLQASVMEV